MGTKLSQPALWIDEMNLKKVTHVGHLHEGLFTIL